MRDIVSGFLARSRQKATTNPRLDGRESRIQAAFRKDRSALIAYLAGRRHGKTEGVATRIATYARPDATTAYVAPTITRAHEILVPVLRTLQREVGLQFDLKGSDITFPNGGQVRLMGMSNIAEVQKLRGEDLLAAYFDECFVSSTVVRPVGEIVGRTTKAAPSVLISLDGVTSTLDHPWLTPEGWKRAEEIVPGDLLCVWEPDDEKTRPLARDVLSGVSLDGALKEPTSAGLAAARAQGGNLGGAESQRTPTVRGVPGRGPCAAEGTRTPPAGAGRERPWAYAHGVDVARSYGLADAGDRTDRGKRPRADTLQIGSGRRIDASGGRDRRRDTQQRRRQGEGRPKNSVARWQRVGRVEIHERGGRGRYAEVCPDGLVHNLRTESGLYFAGGRLVHNCGVPKSDVLKTAVLECAWEALRKHRGEPGSGAVMCGTPGPVPGSKEKPDFWHEVSSVNHEDGTPMYGASRHFGLIFDNPLFAGGRAERSIEEDLRNRLYLSRDDSKYRREVLAQWCISNELRCYSHFTGNVWPDSAAPTEGRTIMAVDFGWNDETAIVVLRLSDFEETAENEDGSKTITRGERVHVLYCEKRAHWQLDKVAAKVEELRNVYHVGTVVGDQGGGASLQVIESWANMFGVPMIRSQKNALGLKRSRIHTINDLFAIGHIVFYEGARCLADELMALVWNDGRDDHHERQPDHAADAFGYGIIETYIPTTVERESSAAEKAAEARAAERRRALSEPFRGRR